MGTAALRAGLVAAAVLAASARPSAQDTWQPLTTGTTQDLHAVHFVSASAGYVAGAGTVLKTTDGGTTWANVSPSGAPDLHGVHFFDAATGVVVGAQGTILRTADGGATWTPVTSGTSETLFSVAFAGSVGIAGGTSQTILRSADAGATWTVVQEGFFGGGFPGADMVDGAVGFVAGQNSIFQPLVGATADGGATFDFTAFYLNSNEGALRDARFLDATTGVAAGVTWDGQGALSRTADGGATWTTTLVADPLEAVEFASAQTGYAAGWSGRLLKSTDGGLTWAPVPSGSVATLNALAIPTPSTGYAAGSGGTVLKGTLSPSTGVPDGAPSVAFALEPNHPNPFDRRTALRFSLPEAAHVRLAVYDALGREVAVLVDGDRGRGWHEAVFDAAGLPAGVYLGVLEAEASRSSRRMLLSR